LEFEHPLWHQSGASLQEDGVWSVRKFLFFSPLFTLPACGGAQAFGPAPLQVEKSIDLTGVAGRIDHLAADPRHHRVFVGELGNGSLDVVDLDTGKTHRITGLKQPQGVGYLPQRNEIVVACGGDGSVRFYDGSSFAEKASVIIGPDADDLRVDPGTGEVAVAYGSGAIAMINPVQRKVARRIALPAHPEGFSIDAQHRRMFVNVPDAQAIAAVDLNSGKAVARWSPPHALNFPMAYDFAINAIAVVFRSPSRLMLFDANTGTMRQDVLACGDGDDVYFDGKRNRLYVSCGSGEVEVFQLQAGLKLSRLANITTRHGARTSLFVPELDRLFVAERAGIASDAALLVLRPQP
jgi:DNA-binding beta-propeller fold protein YncE